MVAVEVTTPSGPDVYDVDRLEEEFMMTPSPSALSFSAAFQSRLRDISMGDRLACEVNIYIRNGTCGPCVCRANETVTRGIEDPGSRIA